MPFLRSQPNAGVIEPDKSKLVALAEQGDAAAQTKLGHMHRQDYELAIKWFSMAAEQGHPSAQQSLGLMYYKGEGVPMDYVQALKWFNLAARSGNQLSVSYRDGTIVMLTPEQIAEAKRLAEEWLEKHK